METSTTFMLKLRNRHFLAADLLIFLLMPALALALRTDATGILDRYGEPLLIVTLVFPPIKLLVYYWGGLYSRYWRYASVDEMAHLALLTVAATLAQTMVFFLVLRPNGWVAPEFPRSIPLLDGLLTLLAVGTLRFSVPLSVRMRQRRGGAGANSPDSKRVLVAGAGAAGVMIVQEIQRNPDLGMKPVAFVDDAPEKRGARIRGVPVLGPCSEIAQILEDVHVDEVIIAMPTAPGVKIREIVSVCEQAHIHVKTIPGMYELLGGKVSVNQLRDVQIEDLLRREPIQTDISAVRELIRGKRVLITGGGGSIGSELCRQILRFEPQSLVVLGHGENSVFEICNELFRLSERRSSGAHSDRHDAHNERKEAGGVGTQPHIHSVIADIRFRQRVRAVFEKYRPQVVFHSAAHKHVHLMEQNPAEAITNNVLGTKYLLEASLATGVDRFVMISTDKAVNPTGVMGASKRAAELLVHQAGMRSGKAYVAVRFGNVLGSRGSVVLTFKQQIAAGGPITVTHPDMMRYFMTIPEAVQLVLQASTLPAEGEVFMLDMGEPVKIVDLARDLIELSGLEEGRDIQIEFTGMRPGEKLYEELFVMGEEYEFTRHEKILTVANASSFVPPDLDQAVAALAEAAERNDSAAVLSGLRALVGSSSRVQEGQLISPPAR